MKKNFNTLITVISLIACYLSVKYLLLQADKYNQWLLLFIVIGNFFFYAWTIYFGIRERTFLVLIKVLLSLISFILLIMFWPFNHTWLYLTGNEIRWLYAPANWILKNVKKI